MERRTKLQKVKRKRKHGFRVHMKSHNGRKVLQKRRLKKRKKLTI
ncbi:MAG: 50S ribosomal protein L34 [bacterium]|nr:50S ribosomal protein L34 [bacterium]